MRTSFVFLQFNRAARALLCTILLVALAHSTLPNLFAAQTGSEQSAGREVVVPNGTTFEVLTMNELFSSTVLEGDAVYFKVADDVVVDGAVVIAKGTNVEGVVAEAELGGNFGITGKLTIEVGSTTTVDGQTVRLNGSYSKRGKANPAAVGALSVMLGILGPAMYHGKSAHIPSGTKIRVSTASEKKVRLKKPSA